MSDLARKTASIYIDQTVATEALIKLQGQADKLTAAIKKGEDAGKSMTKEIAKLGSVKDQIAGVQKQIDQGLRPSFNQLATAANKANAELKKMSQDDPGYAQKAEQVKALKAELGNLSGQIKTVKENSELFGGSFERIFTRVTEYLSAYAIINKLTEFIKGTVDAAIDAEAAIYKFKGTLDNLGRSDAFDRLSKAAHDLHEQFSFLDTPDIIGVFEQLVTFGKLSENQINELTPVIINFAAKSGLSLKEATTTILSAIEGNGRGLKQYGINIKDAKTEAERFGVVIDQLGPKVEGAAEAFGETTQGKLEKTKTKFKELQEEIGNKFLPTINDALAGLNSFLSDINEGGVGKILQRVGDGIEAYWKGGAKGLKAYQQARKDFIDGLTDEQGNKILKVDDSAANNKIVGVGQVPGFFQPKAVSTKPANMDKPFDPNSNGLATLTQQEIDAARKKAEEERKASLARADGFTKQALDEIAKANNQEVQLLKDKYKSEADDQKKSLAERFAAIQAYNDAGLKLIATTTAGQQSALDNEIATDKKNAKSKEELAAIEKLRVAKQADIDKQNALSLSNFKIEVAQKYTDVAQQEFKKQTDLIDKNYQHQKEVADQLAKDQLNNVSINTDNQLLALDKAFQDGKIKNLEDYQKKYDAIVQAGHQKELQQQLKQLEVLQGLLQVYGVKNSDIDKKVADLKVEINKNANDKVVKEDEKALAKKTAITNAIMDGLQQVTGILSTINDAKNAEDEAAMAASQTRLDQDTKNLDRELAKKLISQKEYDRQLKALQDKKAKEDAALKKKEFERNKQAQIIQAIMSGAEAIVSTLAARPGLLDAATFGVIRGVQIALAVATTAAQVAVIASQKAPTYAKGGLLNGPSHTEGGMPVINPRTGKKVAEMEGGEPILSKKTYANNRELVDQLLLSSMYGNGARITPYWQQRSDYKPINYSGINRSMERVNYFAKGGIMPAPGNESQDVSVMQKTLNDLRSSVDTNSAVLLSLIPVIQILSAKADQPVKAYTLLSDTNATQDIYDRIKRETTITR